MSNPDSLFAASGDQPPVKLIDLTPGFRFTDLICAISDRQQRTASNGNVFLSCRLRDSSGERKAIWFSPSAEALELLDGARLVRVKGFVEAQNPAFIGDIKIEDCRPEAEPEDLSPYLPPLPNDHAAQRARFFEVVRAVSNPSLFALLKEIFDPKGALWEQFEAAPAAKNMHHAYRGGLLEHSAEVAQLCERVASTLPYIDRDLLITAALLHDIGKIQEMDIGLSAGEYTEAGNLVGHVVLGSQIVTRAIENIADFPTTIKNELLHLILSHHNRPEHGAAKIPMNAEAIILCSCDLMSARAAQCREALERGVSDDFASAKEIFGWESGKVYLGAMRRMKEATAEKE